MSTAAYDLGRRLRAANDRSPIANLSHAPCLPPDRPVAVQVGEGCDGPTLEVATIEGSWTATGPRALRALREAGVALEEFHRTLVVADLGTLDVLTTLARACANDPELGQVAATVGWWATRAEHPGSGATLVLLDALRQRWTLGVSRELESDVDLWATWLNVSGNGAGLLLGLAREVAHGATLPGLLDVHEQDGGSWRWLRDHASTWHLADGRGQAALGLTTRCDAADLYASLLLDDPLAAARATYSGEVVTGEVVATGPILVRADRPLSRLRAGADVDTWPGEAHQVARTALSGRITATAVDPTGALFLTLSGTGRQSAEVGSRITLRPRRVSIHQQRRARALRSTRQKASANWLSTRQCPTPARREVPLDIAIAAADR